MSLLGFHLFLHELCFSITAFGPAGCTDGRGASCSSGPTAGPSALRAKPLTPPAAPLAPLPTGACYSAPFYSELRLSAPGGGPTADIGASAKGRSSSSGSSRARAASLSGSFYGTGPGSFYASFSVWGGNFAGLRGQRGPGTTTGVGSRTTSVGGAAGWRLLGAQGSRPVGSGCHDARSPPPSSLGLFSPCSYTSVALPFCRVTAPDTGHHSQSLGGSKYCPGQSGSVDRPLPSCADPGRTRNLPQLWALLSCRAKLCLTLSHRAQVVAMRQPGEPP